MRNHLPVLLASLFVVSTGFGITLLVLPFYAERLAMAVGASHKIMAVHVGLLTGVFSLMQLSFAPLAGRLSDRMGFGVALLLLVRTGPQVFGAIGLLALGMAFISPKRLYRNALTPGPSPQSGRGGQYGSAQGKCGVKPLNRQFQFFGQLQAGALDKTIQQMCGSDTQSGGDNQPE